MTWADIVYFTPKEFASPDLADSGYSMDLDFVHKLDVLRGRVGHALKIHSGFRTPAHNQTVNGVDSSAHTSGHAADVEAITSNDKFEILKAAFELGFRRVGIGSSFVHLDDDISKPQDMCWLYPPSEARSA